MKDFIMQNQMQVFKVLFVLFGAMSFITMLLYFIDKQKAIHGKWRIRESVLLSLPWLMGSLGGIIGMYAFRHKTKHWYFALNNIAAFILHLVLLFYVLFM